MRSITRNIFVLGFHGQLFYTASNQFEKDEIEEEIGKIITEWKEKYPNLKAETANAMIIF
jgi:hypothetical protein